MQEATPYRKLQGLEVRAFRFERFERLRLSGPRGGKDVERRQREQAEHQDGLPLRIRSIERSPPEGTRMGSKQRGGFKKARLSLEGEQKFEV